MQDPSATSNPLMQVQKLPTGIEGFDDVCHGGLPIGRSTLISGTSGTGKTVFSLNFLYNGIREYNEPGIFVTFEESPLDILRNAASFGWNLQEMVEQDKLFILDASPDPVLKDACDIVRQGECHASRGVTTPTKPFSVPELAPGSESRRCATTALCCSSGERPPMPMEVVVPLPVLAAYIPRSCLRPGSLSASCASRARATIACTCSSSRR